MNISTIYLQYIEKFLIRYTNLEKEEIINIIKNNKNKRIFNSAITHPNFNKIDNYEDLEHHGDRILKGNIGNYLHYKLPDVKNKKKKFSLAQRYLESDHFLSTICDHIDLYKYIKVDWNKENEIEHFKIKEDVFEAFLGAISQSITNSIDYRMASYITTEIIFKILDELININKNNIESYYDPKDKLEIFLKKKGIKSKIVYRMLTNTKDKVIVQLKLDNNPVMLSKGFNKKDAQNKAAEALLEQMNDIEQEKYTQFKKY